ncbi:DHA2 family efflux MFS transporter permease subunit [Nakamurella leprariae]|nr:DHA2 family efflux MFS transporter permease subunit [Nakamurella leprariae]
MSVDAPATTSGSSVPGPPTAKRGPDQMAPGANLVIAVLLISAFVVILNETIMSVALPRLMEDLDITASTAQWMTTGFMLTMAVVIPATGFILSRYKLRSVFIAAVGIFSVGTLVCAIAPGFQVLLAGRVLQASGTAVMLPLLMTTVMNLVPVASRGRMMGRNSIVIAVAPAIGPTISGIILSALSWRWMFWIVLPIAVASLVLGATKITEVEIDRKSSPFDAVSIVLSAFAFGGLIFGLSSIGESAEGKAPVAPWIPIAIGAAALVLFVVRQLLLARDGRALMDLGTFKFASFGLSLLQLAISMMALFGSLILLPIYLQQVLHSSALSTGLMVLPGGVVMAVMSPVVGRWFDRVGPRPLAIPGAMIVAGALWLFASTLDESTSRVTVVLIHTFMSAGLALIFTPLFTSALGSLPSRLYPHGSAIIGTVQQLAGAAGTAVFITLMTTGTASRLDQGLDQVAAEAGGVHSAFLVGGIIALAAVVASFFVRRPEHAPSRDVAVH